MGILFFQYHLTKMHMTNLSGFWIMTILNTCMACSRKLMVGIIKVLMNVVC